MGKNWDKLKGHGDVKQDINRRSSEVMVRRASD